MWLLAFIIGGLYYKLTNKKLSLSTFNSGVASGQKLLSLERVDRSSLHGCSAAGISSCHRATIDLGILKTSSSIELEGVQLDAVRRTNKSVVFQVRCRLYTLCRRREPRLCSPGGESMWPGNW